VAYDAELQEYVEDAPVERESGRRRLLLIILGVACVALAVSNLVLASRLMELRDRTAAAERAAAPREPGEAPAPGRTDTEPASAPSASIPQAAPATAAPEVPPGPAPTPSAPVAEPAPAVATAPPADLPPRPAPRRPASGAAASTPRSAPGSTTAGGRERSTASWMVQEYGRAEAEARARAAAGFYDARSAERAYWGRVLGEIEAADR
jgi:type IV secretory pathway VirB10-like protein